MKEEHKKWLEDHFGSMVAFGEPMSFHTTFGIGGPANIVTIKTDQQLRDLTKWAYENDQPIMILGAGSNILVRDGGIQGVVIKLSNGFEAIERLPDDSSDTHMRIVAGAGVLLQKLCNHALNKGLAGLNFALGIPGSIGGALRMNAGARGKSIADSVTAIGVLNKYGEIITTRKANLCFSYRGLELEEGSFILRGEFQLKRADPVALRKEAAQILKKRASSQPMSLHSAGCFFLNPSKGSSAGKLVDMAGLKGLRVGGAEVSTKHANFVVNKGGAKASDVISLTQQIKDSVFSKFGISLEQEVVIVGEETFPQESLQE